MEIWLKSGPIFKIQNSFLLMTRQCSRKMFVTENYDEIVEEIEVESDDEYEECIQIDCNQEKCCFILIMNVFFFITSVFCSVRIFQKSPDKTAENLT